jgi:hypothetical protein
VFGKVVEIRGKEYDQYDHLVARVIADGQEVSVALVQAGLAWHYKKYSSDPALARAEKVAHDTGIGICSLPNPTPQREIREQAQRSTVPQATVYHRNRKSHVFHPPHCRYYNCKNCTVFSTQERRRQRLGIGVWAM